MEGAKPLIFIKPYTKTIEKLKEVLEESSEQQGTEIYEIEDVQEAIQLLPQIDQCLVIAAHPRKTAMLLQACKQYIKKSQSKVLLISPKPIPRRTVDKFMKVGLTECIVEPIVPKTLQYKINLLIRSIVIKKEEGAFEKKFDADAAATEADIEVKEIQRKQREALEAAQNTKQDQDSLSEEDLYGTAKKKQTQENVIEGFYKGRVKKGDEEEFDDEDSTTPNSENVIEGYYKGTLEQSDDEEEVKAEKKKKDLSLEDDDISEIASRVNLVLGDDEDEIDIEEQQESSTTSNKKKKSSPSLNIEEDLTQTLKKEIDSEEDALGDIASHHLDLIDDLSDELEDAESSTNEEISTKKKTAPKLEIEKVTSDKNTSRNDEKDDHAKRAKKSNLDLEEDDLDLTEEESLYGTKEKKQKSQKTHLDLESDELAEDEEVGLKPNDDKIAKQKSKLDIEKEDDDLGSEESSHEEESESKKKKNTDLDIEKDFQRTKKKESSESDDSDSDLYSKKKVQLEIDGDALYNTDNDALDKRKKAREDASEKSDLDIEDDLARKKGSKFEESDYARRNSGFTEKINEKGGNRADAHSDKIKTHYDSRNGITHGDDEWRGVERERQIDENWGKNKKNEFVMPEKEAFGEQTIDYADLKKQFDAIEYDLSGKKKVGEFEDGEVVNSPLGFKGAIVSEAVRKEASEDEEAQHDNEEEHLGPIQEAHLKSTPSLVRSLALYLVPNTTRDTILRGILELLRDNSNVLVAIKYGKGPNDGKVKIETFEDWLDDETKLSLLNARQVASDCPILPAYSDKTFEEKKTTFFYPFTEGITTFAWAECYFPAGTTEDDLRGIEAVLETARGVLLDEFHELGGTGPYAELKKKTQDNTEGAGAKVKGFIGKLFGKKKAS